MMMIDDGIEYLIDGLMQRCGDSISGAVSCAEIKPGWLVYLMSGTDD